MTDPQETMRAQPAHLGVQRARYTAGLGGIVQWPAWGSARSTFVALGGLSLLAGFVGWARGRPDAAMDLSLFPLPSYRCADAARLVFGATLTMMFPACFLFLTGPWHYGLARAGLVIAPGPLAVIPMAVLEGRMAARIGHRPLLAFGGGGGAGRRQRRGIRSPQNGPRPAGHRRRADSVAVPAGEIPASSGSPCSQKAALHRRRMRAAKQPGLA